MSAVEWPAAAPTSKADQDWAAIGVAAPQLAATMRRYLDQIATVLAAASVDVTDNALRQLARFLLEATDVRAVTDVRRGHVEEFKRLLAAQPGVKGAPLAANTRRQRLQVLRMFFERIIEWDWSDTPARNPVLAGDIPPSPEPLPKCLDDTDAARVMAAARTADDERDRLVVELLARTGMRAGELCHLDVDAVVLIGEHHWLRIPVGKLRNDRYVPLHPDLAALLGRWCADNVEHIRYHRRLIADQRGPLDRHHVGRIVRRIGRRAGVTVHPHQLRHTLATQAINRGMRLEAIAALLGHRSMHMTLTYARIADRVVADQYDAVSAKVDALYDRDVALPADVESATMAKLRREAHARMLGNGLCTRPVELDCRMDSACETCSYFHTDLEFRPVLIRQRDHARSRGQVERAAIFEGLIERVEREGP
jgi:site-specific recombinase XerD